MKIDKAIEILECHTAPKNFAQYEKHQFAQRLGIEALKRCKLVGRYTYGAKVNLLQGETEE